jgi:hypothetical protein
MERKKSLILNTIDNYSNTPYIPKKVPLKIKINLRNNKFENIKVYNTTDPEELAYNFCNKNNLEYKLLQYLTNKIKNIKESYYNKNKTIENDIFNNNIKINEYNNKNRIKITNILKNNPKRKLSESNKENKNKLNVYHKKNSTTTKVINEAIYNCLELVENENSSEFNYGSSLSNSNNTLINSIESINKNNIIQKTESYSHKPSFSSLQNMISNDSIYINEKHNKNKNYKITNDININIKSNNNLKIYKNNTPSTYLQSYQNSLSSLVSEKNSNKRNKIFIKVNKKKFGNKNIINKDLLIKKKHSDNDIIKKININNLNKISPSNTNYKNIFPKKNINIFQKTHFHFHPNYPSFNTSRNKLHPCKTHNSSKSMLLSNYNNLVDIKTLRENIISKNEIEKCFINIFNFISKNKPYFDVFFRMNMNLLPSNIFLIIKNVLKKCGNKRFIHIDEFVKKGVQLFNLFSKTDRINILNFNISL